MPLVSFYTSQNRKTYGFLLLSVAVLNKTSSIRWVINLTNLPLKLKKILALIVDVEMIFELHEITFSVSFFLIWNDVPDKK